MGIFSRMTEIINANINAVLEKAEDPEKIVRLMIQEMEDTLVEVRSTAAKAIADKKEKHRALTYLEQEQIDWEQKAELALEKGREDLAKAALVEKTKVGDRIEALKKELSIIDSNLEKLNDDIAKLQSKLTDAKNRQRTLSMRHTAAETQLKAKSRIHDNRIDDVLNRFEYAERRIDEVESEAEALEMGRNRTLADEINDLARDEKIDAELETLKKKVKSTDAKDAG
ncbi:MAG: phage shock protein PspA [Xanthomonadales bacterium]|nr:phage shock protein PspA [Xanthomonadales bacterium]